MPEFLELNSDPGSEKIFHGVLVLFSVVLLRTILREGVLPDPKIEKVSKLSALAFLSEMQLSRASKVICEVK
jgi:hypothetical protein